MPFRADQNGIHQNNIVRFLHDPTKDFLLMFDSTDYWAYFIKNQLVEKIDPIDGLPRPIPETATRTKGYKVPTHLRSSTRYEKAAARYTGLARLAVGEYHSLGNNSPFHSTYTKCHGIVKVQTVTPMPDNQPVNKYFVVEIIKKGEADEGVYCAPIEWEEKGTGHAAVPREIKPESLEPYYSTIALPGPSTNENLDLAWAFTNSIPNVQKLTDGTDLPPTNESVWYAAYGWAFSKSGHECQITTSRRIFTSTVNPTDDANPLNARVTEVLWMQRYKMAFAGVGTDNTNLTLSVAITKPETDKAFTVFDDFNSGAIGSSFTPLPRVYLPLSTTAGTEIAYKYTNRMPGALDVQTFDLNNPIDAPIHVYYIDDTEQIVRYSRTTPGGSNSSATPDVNYTKNGVPLSIGFSGWYTADGTPQPLPHCQRGNITNYLAPATAGPYNQTINGNSHVAGFFCPTYDGRVTFQQQSQLDIVIVAGTVTPSVNTIPGFSVVLDCNGDSGTYTLTQNSNTTDYVETGTNTETKTAHEHNIFFPVEDRETVFLYTRTLNYSRVDTDTRAAVGQTVVTTETGVLTAGTGTWQTSTQHSGGATYSGAGLTTGTPAVGMTGTGKFITGRAVENYPLTIEAGLGRYIQNPPVKLLNEPIFNVPPNDTYHKAQIDTTIQAAHGNMVDVWPEKVPSDQRSNSARRQDDLLVTTGGFANTTKDRIVGFIGRA